MNWREQEDVIPRLLAHACSSKQDAHIIFQTYMHRVTINDSTDLSYDSHCVTAVIICSIIERDVEGHPGEQIGGRERQRQRHALRQRRCRRCEAQRFRRRRPRPGPLLHLLAREARFLLHRLLPCKRGRPAELQGQVHGLGEGDGEEGELGLQPRAAGEEDDGGRVGGAERGEQGGGEPRAGHRGLQAQVHVRAGQVAGGGAGVRPQGEGVGGGGVEEVRRRRLREREIRVEEQKARDGVEQDLQG